MRKVLDTAVGVLVGFLVTLALTSTSNYVTAPSSTVTTGYVTLAGQLYATVDIENKSLASVNGLRLAIPSSVNIARIEATPPVRLTAIQAQSGTGSARIEVSAIEPQRITRLFVPVQSLGDLDWVFVTNAGERNLQTRSSVDVQSRIAGAIRSGIIPAVVYAIIYGVFAWWYEGRRRQLEEKAERITAENKLVNAKLDSLQSEVGEAKEQMTRRSLRERLLLLARINDYSKELSFWRDTIRQFLVGMASDSATAEALIEQVTASLRTFTTRSSAAQHEWESIRVAESLLAEGPAKK